MSAGEYALVFVLTWLVESAVLALVVRAGIARILLVSFAVNLLTNPLANWAHHETDLGLGLIEGCVWAVEAALFAVFLGLTLPRALLVSLAVNGVTASASFLL